METSKCPQTEERLEEATNLNTENKLMPFEATWMQLGMRTKRSKSERKTNAIWYYLRAQSAYAAPSTYALSQSTYSSLSLFTCSLSLLMHSVYLQLSLLMHSVLHAQSSYALQSTYTLTQTTYTAHSESTYRFTQAVWPLRATKLSPCLTRSLSPLMRSLSLLTRSVFLHARSSHLLARSLSLLLHACSVCLCT